jgi:hypothetical protein
MPALDTVSLVSSSDEEDSDPKQTNFDPIPWRMPRRLLRAEHKQLINMRIPHRSGSIRQDPMGNSAVQMPHHYPPQVNVPNLPFDPRVPPPFIQQPILIPTAMMPLPNNLQPIFVQMPSNLPFNPTSYGGVMPNGASPPYIQPTTSHNFPANQSPRYNRDPRTNRDGIHERQDFRQTNGYQTTAPMSYAEHRKLMAASKRAQNQKKSRWDSNNHRSDHQPQSKRRCGEASRENGRTLATQNSSRREDPRGNHAGNLARNRVTEVLRELEPLREASRSQSVAQNTAKSSGVNRDVQERGNPTAAREKRVEDPRETVVHPARTNEASTSTSSTTTSNQVDALDAEKNLTTETRRISRKSRPTQEKH